MQFPSNEQGSRQHGEKEENQKVEDGPGKGKAKLGDIVNAETPVLGRGGVGGVVMCDRNAERKEVGNRDSNKRQSCYNQPQDLTAVLE